MPYGLWPARFAVDPGKAYFYLLNPDHPKGGPKAKFFVGIGYDRHEPQLLDEALLRHAALENFAGITVAPFGLKYVFEGDIRSKAGPRRIRSVWQVRAWCDGTAWFVTAVPAPARPGVGRSI